MKVYVDTREQRPWELRGHVVRRIKLCHGDYSLPGLCHKFEVERKGLADLLASLTVRWPAFGRKLRKWRRACGPGQLIIVECSLDDVLSFEYCIGQTRQDFLSRLALLAASGFSVLFAGGRRAAEDLALRALEHARVAEHRRQAGEAGAFPRGGRVAVARPAARG